MRGPGRGWRRGLRPVLLCGCLFALAGSHAAAQAMFNLSGGVPVPLGRFNPFSTGWLVRGGVMWRLGDAGASAGVLGFYSDNGRGGDGWTGLETAIDLDLAEPAVVTPFLSLEGGLDLRHDPTDPDAEVGWAMGAGLGLRTAPKPASVFVQASWNRLQTFNFARITAGVQAPL